MITIAMEDSTTSPLLRHYRALESASAEMLEAARRGDWDSVCRLEAACVIVIAQLRSLAGEHPLTAGEQPERLRILRAILSNDAEIRRIGEPLPQWMDGVPAFEPTAPPPGAMLH
jgi:flagellar protein FliT